MELESLDRNLLGMWENEGNKSAAPRTTYFAEGTFIEGTLHSDRDVEIAGEFRGELISEGVVTLRANTTSTISAKAVKLYSAIVTGDITAAADVVVDKNSTVTGNVRAETLDTYGTIRGNLHTKRLTLAKYAEVIGDVSTQELVMEERARLTGFLDMSNKNGGK